MHEACRAVICRAGVIFHVAVITSPLLALCIFVVISQPDSSELTAVQKSTHVGYILSSLRKSIICIHTHIWGKCNLLRTGKLKNVSKVIPVTGVEGL
jgi:hypothetical protein